MNLREIFDNELTLKCDKWEHYFEVYETYFSKWKNKSPVFMEVGVQNGGSMQMWKKYFGEGSQIYGIDKDESILNLPVKDICQLIIGDQKSMSFWNAILKAFNHIDIFLDDGGHHCEEQINTLISVWPKISPNGIYLCEDVCTSYWSGFGGGLRRDTSMIEFCKNLIDVTNEEHVKRDLYGNVFEEQSIPNDFLNLFHDLGSVHFHNSMIVLTKNKKPFVRTIANENNKYL